MTDRKRRDAPHALDGLRLFAIIGTRPGPLVITDRARSTMIFRDRTDAGQQLATKLQKYARRDDVVVLGLPRGGVPVAYEVAKALDAPMDVFLIRKLGVPGHEELAMGAIASGGTLVLNDRMISYLRIPDSAIEAVAESEERELERRERAYRGGRSPIDVKTKTVVVVDDGLATGASMRAAAIALREHDPAKIVVAVPVAAEETCESFAREVDATVCVITPAPFYGVGMWYMDFSQTTDEEVRVLLARAGEFGAAAKKTIMANKSKNKVNQPPSGEGKKQSPNPGREFKLDKRSEVAQAQHQHSELNFGTEEDREPAERGERIVNPNRPKAGR